MQNLALIEQSGFHEVTMPCAACFNRHKVAQYEMRHDAQVRQSVESTLEYTFKNRVQVHTLLETLNQHVGPKKLAQMVKQPLVGLRVVSYYGCLLTRPSHATEHPHPENPTEMDELMRALGAEVHDWSYKTTCCGAAHSLTRPDIVLRLSSKIIEHARQAGANVIAVACPLCHTNLDARQFQMKLDQPMPVLYFTQLIALALKLSPEATAFDKNLIDPRPFLQAAGLLV
jgi:heterodisulfide reductase subunit B